MTARVTLPSSCRSPIPIARRYTKLPLRRSSHAEERLRGARTASLIAASSMLSTKLGLLIDKKWPQR